MSRNSMPQAGDIPLRPAPERDTVALLAALSLFLSTVEYLLPRPIPFLRIGLSNLPLLLALDLLPAPSYALLALLKVAGQSLITGSLTSWVGLFSLAGTASSALLMFALRRLVSPKILGLVGISVLGAFASNLAQLSLAGLLVFGAGTRYMAPPVLAVGLVTGLLLGLFAARFAGRSLWYRERRR